MLPKACLVFLTQSSRIPLAQLGPLKLYWTHSENRFANILPSSALLWVPLTCSCPALLEHSRTPGFSSLWSSSHRWLLGPSQPAPQFHTQPLQSPQWNCLHPEQTGNNIAQYAEKMESFQISNKMENFRNCFAVLQNASQTFDSLC